MIKKLRSNKFYLLPFIAKKNKLKRFLASHSDCEIGQTILCYEDRDKNFDFRYSPKDGVPEKMKSFTVGKTYKIVDKKPGKIKIIGDTNHAVWTTVDRFLGQTALRAIKLKELNRNKTKSYFLE